MLFGARITGLFTFDKRSFFVPRGSGKLRFGTTSDAA